MITFVLLLASAVCFAAAAAGVPTSRVNLMAAGLFFWVLIPLIAAFNRLS